MRLLWPVFGLPLLLCASARAGAITPEMDRHLMEGVNGIYRMEFDKAEAAARKAIALNPEHPYAYMGLAGITLTRFVYGTDQSDTTLLAPFEAQIDQVIAVAERWLKKHPGDAEALMAQGSALGVSSRLMVVRREWIKAYLRGRKAVQLTRAAVKADPNLYDAYLGIGMYDYYTDLYPRFVGVLAKLVLRGNRQRGIETLKLVGEKGHYSQNTAKILLVEIYTDDPYGARNPAEAVRLMKEFRDRYPNSAMLHCAEIVAFYGEGRYPEAAKGAEDYLRRVAQGVYEPFEGAKGQAMLGAALWAQGRREEALAAFHAGAGVRFNEKLGRWAVWSRIRAGQLEDVMGRRADAVVDYRLAAKEPDAWGFRDVAVKGISKPFRGDVDGPGPITPP